MPARELHADEVALSRLDGDELELLVLNDGREVAERFVVADYPATAHVLATGAAAQVLISDPAADEQELALLRDWGMESLLMVPVQAGGRPVGLIEVFHRTERPWSRTEIHRARVLSHLVGAVLAGDGVPMPRGTS